MLKETETEETIVFFVTILSLVAFQSGGGRAPCPPHMATPMRWKILCKIKNKIEYCNKPITKIYDSS